MMAKILCVKSKNSLKSAIDLGIAMQLTNIAEDVMKTLIEIESILALILKLLKKLCN